MKITNLNITNFIRKIIGNEPLSQREYDGISRGCIL
jgi:hypothetical protein